MTFRPRAALAALPLILALLAPPAHALRVATWNMLDYNASNVAARNPTFRGAIGALAMDVLIVQEIKDAQSADSLLLNVLRVTQPAGNWKLAGFISAAESALFYDSTDVTVSGLTSVATGGPRQVLAALLRPVGYRSNPASFRIYSAHFKAGSAFTSPADSATRRLECTSLRNTLNLAPAGTNILLGGDTNFYGAWEGGYLRLTESQADNDGRLQDPFVLPGTWNSNPSYVLHHSQSPCRTACGTIFSGGGMDDRFDFFLGSTPLFDGAGLDVVPGYGNDGSFVYGQDGQHFNDDLNGGGFNNAVGLTIATALRGASDHLPVVVTLRLPAKTAAPSALAFGDVIVNAVASQNLGVGNAAPVPGDSLRYTLGAPAGFGAPAGTFRVAAGGAANLHAITMDASSVGARAGSLAIAANDPDTASKVVLLSGRVLAHATGSLDSTSAVAVGLLDLGEHTAAAFRDSSVRVHNAGWTALQARLAVSAAVVTGGAGRFSLTAPFTPVLLSGTGQSWNVHFDAAGATPDSTYEATLQFTVQDEALPGAGEPATLAVTLRARPTAGNTGVGAPGVALRFLPPRPNPARSSVELAWDLPREAPVELSVHDLAGRRVATLVDGLLGAGHHQVRWMPQAERGRSVPAGLYFVRFRTPGLQRLERVILLP